MSNTEGARRGLSPEAKFGVFGLTTCLTLDPLGILGASAVGLLATVAANQVTKVIN